MTGNIFMKGWFPAEKVKIAFSNLSAKSKIISMNWKSLRKIAVRCRKFINHTALCSGI